MGFPCPPPGYLPTPGIEPVSPCLPHTGRRVLATRAWAQALGRVGTVSASLKALPAGGKALPAAGGRALPAAGRKALPAAGGRLWREQRPCGGADLPACRFDLSPSFLLLVKFQTCTPVLAQTLST